MENKSKINIILLVIIIILLAVGIWALVSKKKAAVENYNVSTPTDITNSKPDSEVKAPAPKVTKPVQTNTTTNTQAQSSMNTNSSEIPSNMFRIEGRISDGTTTKLLSGVKVTISELNKSVYTDAKGYFIVDIIPPTMDQDQCSGLTLILEKTDYKKQTRVHFSSGGVAIGSGMMTELVMQPGTGSDTIDDTHRLCAK